MITSKTDGNENTQLKNEKEESKEQEKVMYPPVNYFKLQFSLADGLDIFFMILGSIGAMGMGASFPIFSIIFGNMINNFGDFEIPGEMKRIMGELALKLGGVGVAMGIATFLNLFFWGEVGIRIGKKIRVDYFRSLLRQEQGFYDQRNCYEFATKVQSQLKTISTGIGTKVGQVIMSLSMFVGAYVVGFITSWKLSLVLVGLLPFMAIGGYCMTKIMTEYSGKARKYFQEAGGVAEEVLYNIKTVASFGNLAFERKRFDNLAEKAYQKGRYGGLLSALAAGFTFFILFCSYSVAIGFGGYLISNEEINDNSGERFRSGDILIVLFTVVFGAFALGQCAPNFKAISSACEAAGEYFYIKERKPDIDLSRSIEKPPKDSIRGKIHLDGVKFAYPSKLERPILDDLSMTFELGKVTAIVGESGSGKSTIVNLIERLYDVNNGSVMLDELDIRLLDLEYFRSLIGYVPQEPVLFNTTLRDNIIFGRKDITEQEIKDACDLAMVSEFVHRLDNGLDSRVGIKGGKLSGGQKQRVAIARAILKKPKLLILDEATSALDYKSEKEVKRALDQVSHSITTIVIAHRLSTVRNADKIVVLEKGKIAETGTHEELFALGKLYYCLVKNQEIEKSKGGDEVLDTEGRNSRKGSVARKDSQAKIEQAALDIENLTFQERKRKLIEEEKLKDKMIEESKKKLWPFICENPGTLLAATFFACMDGAVWPAYGYLLAEAIFKLANIANPTVLMDDAFFLAMMFLVIAGGAGFSQFMVNTLFNMLGEHLAKSLRIKCYQKYLELHMGFYDIHENAPGALLTKLSSDTTKVNGIALSMFAIAIETISTLLIGLILSLYYCWQLALLCLGLVPVIILSSIVHMKIQFGFSKDDEVIEKSLGAILSECVVNTKTIYCFNMQERAVEMYVEKLNEAASATCTKIGGAVISGISQFFMFFVYAIVFYVGAVLIEKGITDFQNMMRSIFCILFAAFGLGMVQMYIGDYAAAKEAMYNIFRILDTKSEINPNDTEGKIIPDPKTFKGKIEFKNVCFSYPTRKDVQVLSNLSFVVEPNTSAAFVGFSGSGKSSIFQLLLRFYDVNSGQILIDDVDIRDYNLLELRRLFGIVMQEPVLFKTNIFNNIIYGDLSIPEEMQHQRVIECAKNSKVARTEQISKENDDALPVSGGEKQRIAIARCMLRNPRVLFLDEATSALDKNIEEEIQRSLDELAENRTSLVIAHRLSTIENSNTIFYMENGQIKEQGSHSELMALKGKYCSLYKSGNKN